MTNEEARNLIIRNRDVFRYDEDMKQALTLAIEALAERPQGEWKGDGFVFCNQCGCSNGTHKTNFCSNCGAKMGIDKH